MLTTPFCKSNITPTSNKPNNKMSIKKSHKVFFNDFKLPLDTIYNEILFRYINWNLIACLWKGFGRVEQLN